MTRQDYKEPISYQDISLLQAGYIEVYHSEYRNSKIVGKYYAYICYYDEYGNREDFGTTGDFDTPQEAIQNLQKEWQTEWSKLMLKAIENIK